MAERNTRSGWATLARVLGAACVVAAGVMHLQQYFGVYYHVIPNIGPLFLLDFIYSAAACVALLVPLQRLWRPLVPLAALGAIALSTGAIMGLEISENGALFGFHEHGYRLAVVLSLVFEAAAVVSLISYQRTATRHEASPVITLARPNPPCDDRARSSIVTARSVPPVVEAHRESERCGRS